MTEQRAVRRYEQRVSGSGITGDEFQYIETVPASDYDALSTELAEAKAEIERMRERIAELSRQLEQAEAVRSDEAFGGALSDELYKKRIAELEAGIRKWASECAECGGAGQVQIEFEAIGHGCCGKFHADGACCGNAVPVPVPSVDVVECDQCADIRALLPKESA